MYYLWHSLYCIFAIQHFWGENHCFGQWCVYKIIYQQLSFVALVGRVCITWDTVCIAYSPFSICGEKENSLFWSTVCIKDNNLLAHIPDKIREKTEWRDRQHHFIHAHPLLCLWNIYKHLFTTLQYVLFTHLYLCHFFFHWLGILLLYCPRRITADFMSRES